MEREVTKDEKGEYVTPEQAERFRDAAEDVAVFRNVLNVDAGAEVVYLLPRSWQWPQRETLRDLIILLGCGKGGAVMDAEELAGPGVKFRKAAFGYLFSKKDGLHAKVAERSPAERVAGVLAAAKSGEWNAERFGWRSDLLWEYGAMALANDPAESVPVLAGLSSEEGPLRSWALTTLARIDDPAAGAALKAFYSPEGETGPDPARAAALRFYSAVRRWPAELEVAVLVPGEKFPLRPLSAKAISVDQASWDARAADAVRLKLGVDEPSLGRKAFVDDGDRASVVIADVVNRKPGEPDGPTSVAWYQFRLRKRGDTWVVSRWNRTGP